MAFFLAGKFDQAIAAYGRAIELDSKDASPHIALGMAYIVLSRDGEAIAAYERATELDPKDAYSYQGLGAGYQRAKLYEKAEEAFRKAVELDPQVGSFRGSLVGILRKLGRETEAADQIKIARELIAKEDAYSRACLEAICGDADKALALLRMALEKRESPVELAEYDPDFDLLRSDPRFAALIEEMKARYAAG